jgi:tetratricopeptide (TPR) repeat protein
MVATINNEFFEKSKQFFEHADLTNALDYYEKALSFIDNTKEKSNYIRFLNQILEYCKNHQLIEEQAFVLRSLGRTYSIFKNYVESLKYHQESLKIQRKLGKKRDVAEGLLYLAEDLEISGNYDECINTFQTALNIYNELGKLTECKKIKKELNRLKEFSKDIYEAEYIMNKFHLDTD